MPLMLPDIRAPSSQTKRVNATVYGLNPYTQYQFRVVGVNSLGEGRPSKPSREYSALLSSCKSTLHL